MRAVIFKCPPWMFILLIVGAVAPLGILPLVRAQGWPVEAEWALVVVAVILLVYALMMLPTRLVISDDGVYQKLLFSELRLRWEDLVEWRHCDGGAEFEEGEMRSRTKNKWHNIEFWVKDKTGKTHHFKRWLVFGRRSRQVAEIMRERGIVGG